MLVEIDKDFYCSCDFIQMGNYEPEHCHGKTQGYCEGCSARHRKYPTPEQFKEEYGEEYPEKGAVYLFYSRDGIELWKVDTYTESIKENYTDSEIACACTPFGIPKPDWRTT